MGRQTPTGGGPLDLLGVDGDGKQPQIQFRLTPGVWAEHKDGLTELVQSIEAARIEAWHAAEEEDAG